MINITLHEIIYTIKISDENKFMYIYTTRDMLKSI